MGPWIWERKYEIDSLCYPLQFSYLFWKNTGRTDQFDEVFWEGVDKILTVFETEMNHEEKSPVQLHPEKLLLHRYAFPRRKRCAGKIRHRPDLVRLPSKR